MNSLKSFTLILFTFTFYQISGQYSIGFEMGYTNAWEEYGDVDLPANAEINVEGINASVLLYKSLGEIISIGTEPGYIQRGAACVPGWNLEPDPTFNSDTKYFLHYAELPLLLKVTENNREHLSAYCKLGYGLSFLVTATEETIIIGSDELPTSNKMSESDLSRLNRLDHGVYGSIGFEYSIGNGKVFLETDGYIGLRDADKSNKSLNRSFSLNIGYSIDI